MSMQDPIADMLTRIRNAHAIGLREVKMPASRQKLAIADLLKREGYIGDYASDAAGSVASMTVTLKYFEGQRVIEELQRVSRPSLRVYRSSKDLPRVRGGLGTAVISTSRGLMSDREARHQGIGGEVVFFLS